MYEIPWRAASDDFDDLWEDSCCSDIVPDMLETMFAAQQAQMQEYSQRDTEFLAPEEWGRLNTWKTQATLRENASYVVEELYEAINKLKLKPWKQTFVPTDEDEFREELADAWHFFIQLHILAGIGPLGVFTGYFDKAKTNHERRENGY